MKKLSILFTLLFLLLFIGSAFAQRDSERVNQFKDRAKEISSEIDNAKVVSAVDELEVKINSLRQDFAADKSLLDKSLYPETYDSSIQKLVDKLANARGKISQITDLKTEVIELAEEVQTLQAEVTRLTQENTNLIAELSSLKNKAVTDKTEYNRVVSKIKTNMSERDKLIRDMAEELFPQTAAEFETMNETDREEITLKVDNSNIIEYIKKLASDNLAYTEARVFAEADAFDELKREQSDFTQRWKEMGAKLGSLYGGKQNSPAAINEVDAILLRWGSVIDSKIWTAINELFALYKVPVKKFNSGKEFELNIVSYIDGQIKILKDGAEGDADPKAAHYTFSDTLWNMNVDPYWLPLLERHKLLSASQLQSIESKITEWGGGTPKKEDNKGNMLFVYILGALACILLIVVVVLLVSLSKTKSKIRQLRIDLLDAKRVSEPQNKPEAPQSAADIKNEPKE